MNVLFANKLYTILYIVVLLIFRVLYATVIYYKANFSNQKTRNLLTFLSFPFPIVTGIICIVKYRKSAKNSIIILVTLVISLVSVMTINLVYTYVQKEKYYDNNGTEHLYAYDVNFTDVKGNVYTFDFDKSGYDRLYINNTDDYLNADLCYIDSEGYLYYDEDMSITAKDETCCLDEDGSIYYPARYTVFNKDGTINYNFNSANFNYDRFGNAYTYEYVPYYDEDGNKYIYSFDSTAQKGFYTNVDTKEIFDNEYSFVNQNGYFVYDKDHIFTEKTNEENVKTYQDLTGDIYYWASSISWDKEGNLIDSFGKIINN